MAKSDIVIRKTDTVLGEMEALRDAVRQRAYDLFCSGGDGGAVADWLSAERELVSKPAVELRQTEGQFHLVMAVPGVDTKDLDVRITQEDLLVRAEVTDERRSDTATVHMCEFDRGRLFRSIHFPEKVDPASARAECRNGMLSLTVALAKAGSPRKGKAKES